MKVIKEGIIGKHYTELPSPCLLLDLDALDHNIRTMQDYADQNKRHLRPHIKTHKSPMIAHLQIKSGAVGVTCSKLGEAVELVQSGIQNILIANQIVGENKIEVLVNLNRYSEVIACVDSLENAKEIARIAKKYSLKVPVFLEIAANDRCGVRTAQEAIELAEGIGLLDGIVIKGIQAYEGRGDGSITFDEKLDFAKNKMGSVLEIKRALEEAGYVYPTMSSSSTGTVSAVATMSDITELQPGTYVFMESAYPVDAVMLPFRQALFVLTTIVSTYGGRRIVTDSGKKCISVDQGLPHLLLDKDAKIAFHEEHCVIDTTDRLTDLEPGDNLIILPSHCCTTANLHDLYYCIQNDVVVDVWPITARGKVY